MECLQDRRGRGSTKPQAIATQVHSENIGRSAKNYTRATEHLERGIMATKSTARYRIGRKNVRHRGVSSLQRRGTKKSRGNQSLGGKNKDN